MNKMPGAEQKGPMRLKITKLLVCAAVEGVALTLMVPPVHADPTDFSGKMIPRGESPVSAHMHDVGNRVSVMTASNGCIQEWHIKDVVHNDMPGVVRMFAWSQVTSGQSQHCHDSSNLGITGNSPDSPYGLHNGHFNMNVIDQAVGDVSWIMDSD